MYPSEEVLIDLRAAKELDNVTVKSLAIMFKGCEKLNTKHIIYP